MKFYAIIRKVIPDFRFIYVSPTEQLRTIVISDHMKIQAYVPWNYKIMEPTGEYLDVEELTEADRHVLSHRVDKFDQKVTLDFQKMVYAYQQNYSSYYLAENIETLETCDIMNVISDKAFLLDRSYIVMPIVMANYTRDVNPDELTLVNVINKLKEGDKAVSGYIPITLLREYIWTALQQNKKFKLPYITPSHEIRSLHVPKDGIGNVLVFTKDEYEFYEHRGNKLLPVLSYYGKLTKTHPKCYSIPYWDFMKLMLTSFKYTVIDTATGESIKFIDAIYHIAVMGFRGRTTDKIRTMYISTTV